MEITIIFFLQTVFFDTLSKLIYQAIGPQKLEILQSKKLQKVRMIFW